MARAPFAVLLLAFAVLLPAAQAQAPVPTDPKITVSLEVTPTAAPVIPLGATAAFHVNVKLSMQYVICLSPATLTVKLDLKDTGLPGVAGTLPASVDIPVPANASPANAGQFSGQGNASVLLQVAVAMTTVPDHDHAFTLTANTPGAVPSGCQGASPNAPPVSTATKDVAIRTGPRPMATNMTSTGPSSLPSATAKKSFFVPLPLELGTLLAVGLAGRRRL
jgi:hypothetical protein